MSENHYPTNELSAANRELLARFRAGHRPALARAISLVENGRPGFEELLNALHPQLGRAHRIGITGPPGAGKSTLTAALVQQYRRQGLRVGVVAVDPTSPFTGGALLGDRIRMNDIALDDGVFIRSMASRGALGGLALTTREVADVLDAFGLDIILIETVGVGQSELDIAATADSTVVVLVPESGDSIQAMKAGLMEAADLFVINKSDRPGSDRLAREISLMLHLRMGQAGPAPAHHGVDLRQVRAAQDAITAPPTVRAARHAAEQAAASGLATADAGQAEPGTWEIPVLKTMAERSEGVPELVQAISAHAAWLDESGERQKRRRQRLVERVREQVARRLQQLAWVDSQGTSRLDAALPELEAGSLTPYQVAAQIVRAVADR